MRKITGYRRAGALPLIDIGFPIVFVFLNNGGVKEDPSVAIENKGTPRFV